MSVGKGLVLGGAGLGVVEASTGGLGSGLITSTATNIAASANAAVTGAASNVVPYFAGPAAPLATAAYSIYNGTGAYAEEGILGTIRKTAGNYGAIGGLATAAGLMSAPGTAAALATWGVLYGGKELINAGKEFAQDPLGNIGGAISAPFKWAGSAMASLRGRGTAAA